MKRIFSFIMTLALLLPAVTGILSSVAVNAKVNDETVRYTVLILDAMGEYTITNRNGNVVVVGSSLDNVKNASLNFVEKMANVGGENYVAVVRCADESNVECGFSDDEDELGSTISDITESSGFSNVEHSFVLADELMSTVPENAIRNIVYFSGCVPGNGNYEYDGVYSEDDCTFKVTQTTIPVYAHANSVYNTVTPLFSKGYNVYTLGCVTNLEEQPEVYNFFIKVMNDIANAGYYDAANPEDLEFVFGEVAEIIMSSVTGTFKYRPGKDTEDFRDCEATYFYSDNYFSDYAHNYNPHLATMSLCLELSAFSSLEATSKGDYKNQAQNARALLYDIGFDKIMTNDDFGEKMTTESMGIIAAQKQIRYDGDDYTLVAIALRGGGYEAEWASNFMVGASGNHTGFYSARDRALEFVKEYLDSYVSGNVKLWITGFSRGGAVAGLIGAYLNDNLFEMCDEYGISLNRSDIYTYTFEAPMSTDAETLRYNNYTNIFNIVNLNDLVPKVAMNGVPNNGWNFARPGIDKVLPYRTKSNKKDYKNAVKLMEQQLEILNEGRNKDEKATYEVEDFDNWEMSWGEPTQYEFLNDFFENFCTKISREEYEEKIQEPLTHILEKLMGGQVTGWQRRTFITGLTLDYARWAANPNIFKIFNQNLQISNSVQKNLKLAGIISVWDTETDTALNTLLDAIRNLEIAASPSGKPAVYSSLVNDIIAILAEKVFNAHYPELCLAWLMSQDTYYTDEDAAWNFVPADSVTRIVRINCPVDVTVYDAEGNVVAQFVDNVAQELGDDSLYALMHNGEKLIYLPEDGEYTIEITATDDGTMSYSVEEYLSVTGNTKRSVAYLDIPLTEGEIFNADIPLSRDESGETYEVEYTLADGEGELTPDVDAEKDELDEAMCEITVTAENNTGVVTGGNNYLIGERVTLVAYDTECYTFEGWYLDGEKVSDDAEYQFVAKENANYIAKYKDNHTPESNWVIDKEPAIGVAGEKHISCEKCGEIIETAVIDPLPDEKESEEEKEPVPDDKKSSDGSDTDILPSSTVIIVIFASLVCLLIAAVVILVIVLKRRSK